jgi:hypothetical protein
MTEATRAQDETGLTARARSEASLLTRRQLLAGSGQLALLAAFLPTACMPIVNAPWADGTFWDDGKGWTD